MSDDVVVYPPEPSEVAVYPADESSVILDETPTSVVIVSTSGLQGIPGPQGEPSTVPGPPGPMGPPGSAPQAYVHDQSNPDIVWAIGHNLGYRPNVTAIDSAGTTQLGETVYVDENNLEIHFLAAFGGKAYLS
jgi:hypothetical protein